MPFVDLIRLERFWQRVKQYIDSRGAGASAPTPWRYRYDSAGDVLGLERDVPSYTKTSSCLPYKITADAEITDKANAFNDTENTEFATMLTATEERTIKIYLDTQLPLDAIVSDMNIAFKIGTSNISQTMWTKRTYAVKCGGNTLDSGILTLRTTGNIITVAVEDMSLITSPIIEIEITAQTVSEQSVRIFGAQANVTFTAEQEWISVIRQNQLAWSNNS